MTPFDPWRPTPPSTTDDLAKDIGRARELILNQPDREPLLIHGPRCRPWRGECVCYLQPLYGGP